MAEFDINEHEVLDSEKVFDGRVVKVFVEEVRLPDGRTATWERVAHPGAVGMVPLTDDGDVIMVRQYRHAVGGVLLEIPAGKLEAGESHTRTAMRELAEEVGMKASELIPLAEFYNSPGYSDERFYLYLARGLSPESGEAEPDEFLETVTVPLAEALEMVTDGRIRDAKSVIGVALTRSLLSGATGPFTGSAGP